MALAAGVFLIAGLPVAAFAQQPEGMSIVPPRFASAAQNELYNRVSARLIAPCCWAQPVRLHQSEAASRVRMELIADIRAGMDQSQIEDRFAREYGERILGQPRGARSVVAYSVPWFSCALGIVAMGVFLSGRSRRARPVTAGTPTRLPDLPEFD